MTHPWRLWKDACLDVGLGRSYGHTGDATQDCVRLMYAAAVRMYAGVADLQRWIKPMHLNVPDGVGSFANLEAYVESGVAEWVDGFVGRRVLLVQVWWGNRGHMFSCCQVKDGSWRIIEATDATADWFRPFDPEAKVGSGVYKVVALIHPSRV